MFTSRLDVYISRYGDFFAHNDNDTTDYFTPCACVRGKYVDARIQRLEVMQNVSVASSGNAKSVCSVYFYQPFT